MTDQVLADARVLSAVMRSVLPQLYVVIDDLIDVVGEESVPRELLVRAKKMLPAWAPHSFEQTPMRGNKSAND